LNDETEKLASQMGDDKNLVFVLCGNRLGSLIGYVGLINKRAVPLMLDAGLEISLLNTLIETYKPSYIWLPDSIADMFPSCKRIYCACDYTLIQTEFTKDYSINSDLALLLTTSGSTGSPKFVKQSYENIHTNTASIIEYLDIDKSARAITTLPMHYTYGLSILNTHLKVGASVILTEKALTQKDFWRQTREYRATNFGGVPYTYEILKKLRFERMELPYLRYLTQAGGKLSSELCAEFVEICGRKGMEFIVMYGQTEATARMSYLPWKYAKAKSGSMGIAIPGGEFWLIGDDGSRVSSPGVVGELVYRGRNVTLGYAESRFDLCKGDERGGVLETGDMAYIDEDGFYYIAGRKKRFLKIYGNRVNLDEAEGLLKKAGFDCACAGVDDNLKIYTATGDAEEVRRYVINRTGINPSGFSVVHINEIPRNTSGKVLYSELGGQ